MARLLIISTHGSEDPTRAGLAFFMAKGAVEAEHKPEIVLAGDASVLARKVVADSEGSAGPVNRAAIEKGGAFSFLEELSNVDRARAQGGCSPTLQRRTPYKPRRAQHCDSAELLEGTG